MAMFTVSRYVSMAKVGMDRGVIEQRIAVDLQVEKDETAIITFVNEIVSGKEEFTKEIVDKLLSLANSKYQRLESKGVKSTEVNLIKLLDQPEKAADLHYKYDPPAVLVAFDDEHSDQVIGDKDLNEERPSHKRAMEFKREASRRRKEGFENLVKEFQLESAGKAESSEELTSPLTIENPIELPVASTFSSHKSYPEPTILEKLGEFHHGLLQCYFTGNVVLPERMYILDNVLSRKECDKIISKLNFSEEEIRLQNLLLAEEKKKGKIIMRTSLRRRFVNPNLAKLVWEAVKRVVPRKLQDGRELVGIRSLANFYRYEAGQYFSTHFDGGFKYRDTGVFAEFTFLLYLNEDYMGGTTRFCDVEEWEGGFRDIQPKMGRILVFRQRDMKHCGAQLLTGTKYVIQGMVMYSPHEHKKPSAFRPSACECE